MIIYVVHPGDSLFLIAQRYGVTVQALIKANRLISNKLAIGQRLFIPVSAPVEYTVKSGDTLYQIANRYDTTTEAIILLNDLKSPDLSIGQKLIIPVYTEFIIQVNTANLRGYASTQAPIAGKMDRGARLPVTGIMGNWIKVRLYDGRTAWTHRTNGRLVPHSGEQPIEEVFAFYTEQESATLPSSYDSFVRNTSELSNTGMFHFRISREHPTQIEKFPASFTDDYMREVIAFGHRHNIKMLPTLHNLLYESGKPSVNQDVIHEVLDSEETRSTFIEEIVGLIQAYGFDGINIDFEDVRYEDREKLSAFYTELGGVMKEHGYYYSVDVPSKTSEDPSNLFSAPFDYRLIGRVADDFVLMLYNEHGWPGSGPGPVVSIDWMESVVGYAVTQMPAGKITAALSVFGFDFNLRTNRSKYSTYDMAMNLAKKYGKDIIFDEKTQTPMFAYTDENGDPHEVWFENARSIQAKMELAHRMGIRGIALWRLGMEDPAIWPMMADNFVISKSMI